MDGHFVLDGFDPFERPARRDHVAAGGDVDVAGASDPLDERAEESGRPRPD